MDKKAIRMGTLQVILRYVGKYKGYLWLSLLLSVVQVGATLYIPVLTGRAIDTMVAPGQVDFSLLSVWILQIGISVAVAAAAQWLTGLVNNRTAFGTVRDIRADAFDRIQQIPLSVLDKKPIGDMVSRVIADVEQLGEGLLMGVSQLFISVLTILTILVFMYVMNPLIATVVVVVTPLSLWLASFIAKRTYAMFLEQTKTRGEQTALVDEVIANQKVIQAFSQETAMETRFDEVNHRFSKASMKAVFFSSIAFPSTRCINAIVYACVGTVGAILVVTTGGISVGALASFLSYTNQYTKPFTEISGVVTELQNAMACARRVFELMDMPTESSEGETSLSQVDGRVSLEKVSFSYEPNQKLIENLNLTVHKGQRVAIVGPTGCGKTTLINLLMRFYDVNRGEIQVSGFPLECLTRRSLRTAYGMVLQDTWLKTGTVRDNLIMGKEDATEEEIIAAAKATHAHSFIRRLPSGYDTVITEEGGNLSQGEKQLLCITRVMLCLPPMLILDEATSSIDTRTERYIQDSFAKMMEGRTSFIVAHRLSTVQHASVILVMNEGKIVEQGTHGELLDMKGFYYRLHQSQFSM